MKESSTRRLELLRDGSVPLHRATDTGRGTVLIAGYRAKDARASVLASLQRVYAFRTELDPDWAVMPVELSMYDDELVLVLDDPGGQPLTHHAGRPLEIGDFLWLAISVTSAIGAMHARSIAHGDINPDNILADVSSGRWKTRLTGFEMATRLPRHTAPVAKPEWPGGNFAYMAPEFGGRMSVPADARADLYSLGCVLYLLLTGVPPFNAGDAAASVHAHAVRRPLAPADRVPGVPAQLSRIVMKLLEKSPDERYQSASSLLVDLQRCLMMWQHGAEINTFPLDADNVLARLVQTGRIFGRERELAAIADSFDRVAQGIGAELVLVAGHSGIGKSALVHEAILRLQAHGDLRFAASKHGKASSAVPYSGLSQVLECLMRPILGYGKSDFLAWRQRIAAAVGLGGRLLERLVPTLGTILGEGGPLVELSPHAERECFLQASVGAIGVFAVPDRPLVLFFDDLQWADIETLTVIERLLADMPELSLLVMGAFREGEADGGGPVRLGFSLDAARVSHVSVMPLELSATRKLVGNVLQCGPEQVAPLADLIEKRTGGNPFFAKQFLTALMREGSLSLGSDSKSWVWDMEQVRARGYTGDVVDLMLLKLDLLPVGTQSILRHLACLGDRAPISTLSAASALDEDALQSGLRAAVEANCIYLDGGEYVFWHDRIRETAYASIPVASRAGMHLEIGRRLAAGLDGEQHGAPALFCVAGQINKGKEWVTSPTERLRFARLNLRAAQQAKATTAYTSALIYFNAAVDFLEEQSDSDFARTIQFYCGECEFMTGALAQAEIRLTLLAASPHDILFGAKLARLRILLYTTLSRPDLALEAGFDFLGKYGMVVPSRPTDEEVAEEFGRMIQLIAGRDIVSLAGLPAMRDPIWRAVIELLSDLVPPALFTDANLIDFVLTRMTTLSLEHGHADASCHSYALMALVCGARYGDYEMSHAFGELAIRLVDEYGLSRYKARAYMAFGAVVLPWTRPIRSSYRFLREAFHAASESADLTFAVYCGAHLVRNMIAAGAPLGDIRSVIERTLALARASHYTFLADAILSQLTLVHRYQGAQGAATDGCEELAVPAEGGPQTLMEFCYWVHELRIHVAFDNLAGALEAERRAAAGLSAARSFIDVADFHFYGALARVAACRAAGQDSASREILHTHIGKLSVWTHACPENFASRLALVLAEVARLEGRVLDAERHYKEALDHAREHNFPHILGMASELAAAFYGERGHDIIARAYLRHARQAYLQWGAYRKIEQIDRRHPHLNGASDDGWGNLDRFQQLDVNAMIKVSNVLTSEIVLSRLVETVMTAALENAGADGGVLAMLRGGKWQIQAQAKMGPDGIVVTQRQMEPTPETLPLSLVQTVARTMECLVLSDAREAEAFAQDPYIQRYQPRSVLCVPLIKQSVLTGLLYLENNVVTGVFTPDKAAVLEVIACHAAIALENAFLYEDLIEQNRQRACAEEALRVAQAELARVGRLTAIGELAASIVHEVSQPISAVDTSASAALRWLDRARPDVGEARLMLDHIVCSVRRAKHIVQGLRAMAKKSEPQFEIFDINAAIREVVALLRHQLDDYRVVLQLRGIDAECLVSGDRVQVQQVVLNLLMNGAESMAEVMDRPRVMVVTSALAEAGIVRVTIDDVGSGIEPGALAQIFAAFFTTKADGMGMGLSISSSIIEAHGGTLTASPRQPVGTEFSFTIAQAR